jgi:hypothetical protein
MSYLEFVDVSLAVKPPKATKVWNVRNKSGSLLGGIAWFPRWRKYVYYPNPSVSLLLDEDCLRELSDFCSLRTKEYYDRSKTETPGHSL